MVLALLGPETFDQNWKLHKKGFWHPAYGMALQIRSECKCIE